MCALCNGDDTKIGGQKAPCQPYDPPEAAPVACFSLKFSNHRDVVPAGGNVTAIIFLRTDIVLPRLRRYYLFNGTREWTEQKKWAIVEIIVLG